MQVIAFLNAHAAKFCFAKFQEASRVAPVLECGASAAKPWNHNLFVCPRSALHQLMCTIWCDQGGLHALLLSKLYH